MKLNLVFIFLPIKLISSDASNHPSNPGSIHLSRNTLIRNPLLTNQLAPTCPAQPTHSPSPNQRNLNLPKICTFQQWKASKQPKKPNHPIHPGQVTLNPSIRSNQDPPYTQHQFNPSNHQNHQHLLPFQPHPILPQDSPLIHQTSPSLQNLSGKPSSASPQDSTQDYPQHQLLSFNLKDSLHFDTYHPDPNTGTGHSDDPLKILSTRTNYASVDCSASIHRASKQSKSPSAILNEKKDKYMLTPCASNKPIPSSIKNASSTTTSTHPSLTNQQSSNFVVFELCDEIEIDCVVLANFEFFSSMFKTIRMSVSNSGVEGVHGAEWVYVGYLKTHNIRGFQVFFLKHLKGFYRYVRLDFLAHYGSEYYCPLSLVRIYGLTQIDAYRRDTKLEEHRKVRVEVGGEDEQPIESQDKQEENRQSLIPTQQYSLDSTSGNLDSTHSPHLDPIREEPKYSSRLNQIRDSNHPQDTVVQLHADQEKPSGNISQPYINILQEAKSNKTTERTYPSMYHDQTESSPDPVSNTLESSPPNSAVDTTQGSSDEPQQDQSLLHTTQKVSQQTLSKINLETQPAPPVDSSSSSTQTSSEPDSLSNSPQPQNDQDLENSLTVSQGEPSDQALSSPSIVSSKPPTASPLPDSTTMLPSPPIQGEKGKKSPGPSDPPPPQRSLHNVPPKTVQPNDKLHQPNVNLPSSTGSSSSPQSTQSIFGQIMKRLNYLESNHHLLLNYLEEQVLVLESSGDKLRKKLVKLDRLLKIQIKKQEENRREIKKIKNEIISIENFINIRFEALESTIVFIKRFGLIQFLSILLILIFLGLTRTSSSHLSPVQATRASSNNAKRNKSRLSHGSRTVTENDTCRHSPSRVPMANGGQRTSMHTVSRSYVKSSHFSSSSPNKEFIVSSPSRIKTYSSRSPQHSYRINSPPSSSPAKKASFPPILMEKFDSNSHPGLDKKKHQQPAAVDEPFYLTNTHQKHVVMCTQKGEKSIVESENGGYKKRDEEDEEKEESVSMSTNGNTLSDDEVEVNSCSEEEVKTKEEQDSRQGQEIIF